MNEPRRPFCEYCGRSPHAMGCPNEPDPPVVFICSGCSGKIRAGDGLYDVLGEQFCEDCMRRMHKEAEYDPY